MAIKKKVGKIGAGRKAKPVEMIKVKALGGLKVRHLGTATEGVLTRAQFDDLAKLKLNNKPYVQRVEHDK